MYRIPAIPIELSKGLEERLFALKTNRNLALAEKPPYVSFIRRPSFMMSDSDLGRYPCRIWVFSFAFESSL